MVIKVEIKYKVIFQSKYECHSSQIEVKHVLSTDIWFFWILPDILFFRKKNFWNFCCWDLCEKIWVWSRNGNKMQMLQICLLQNTFLALKKCISNLESEKKNVRTVSTIVEHSYYVKNKLLGYTFPNISKKVSLYLPPQFHHKFREGYCGQSRFDSWQFFLHQKMLYKML